MSLEQLRQAAALNIPTKDLVKRCIERVYPLDQMQRIEHLFNEECPPSVVPTEPLKSLLQFDSNHTVRLAIIAGIHSPAYIESILRDPEVNKNVKAFIFIENNPEVIKQFLNWKYFPELLVQPTMRFIFNHDAQSLKAALFTVLRQPQYSVLMECAQYFYNTTESPERINFYKTIESVYDETVFHIYHNYGNVDDSIEGVKATLLNADFILNNPGWEELADLYKDKPAIVVAAGPSLDKDIEKLKLYKDQAVIIAADAAVKPLLKAGVEPQFCTSIERGNIYQRPFWEGLPPIKTELVAYPVVHPEVLAIYPGPKRVVYRNYTYYAYLEHSWKRGISASGGSTTHLAMRLAEHLGCSKILFVGKDNAYEEREDGLVRSHCNGLGHETWAEWKDIKDFSDPSKGGIHPPAYKALAFDGSHVWTTVTYHQWAKECDEHIMALGLNNRVFVTNPKSVKFSLASVASLEQFFEGAGDFVHPVMSPSQPKSTRSWNHKFLYKCFKTWLATCDKADVIIDKARENPPDAALIMYLFDLLSIKFKNDTLFVGFVIQNCAAEFYQFENDWMAFPNELTDKYSERLNLFKLQTGLFRTVIEKLLTVIPN